MAKSVNQKLGDSIRSIRKERGISQEELAAKADIERSYMGKIERGEANASVATLFRISRSLKTNLSTLFAFDR